MPVIHTYIQSVLNLIKAGAIERATDVFVEYYRLILLKTYKGVLFNNIIPDPSVVETIEYNIDLISNVITSDSRFDTLRELIRISRVNLSGIERKSGMAGTKRKRNNNLNNMVAAPRRRNNSNNTGLSGLKLRVKAPFGTLKQNRYAAATKKPAPKKPRWIGYAELPNSPVAAAAPLKPKNRYGHNLSASNNSNIMHKFAAARGEIPTTALPAAALLPGFNNNSNNDPFASAYAPGYAPPPFPNVSPMRPALNVGPGPLSLVLPYGRNAPQSPGFRPRASNTLKSTNNLRAMGFRGGKRSTRRKLRSRSTRRRKL